MSLELLNTLGTLLTVAIIAATAIAAIVQIGNRYEELGLLIKKGTIESGLFLDFYSIPIIVAWKELKDCLAFWRAAQVNDTIWENFEYLAVLAEDWLKNHPTTYPKGVRHMQMENPWPVPPVSATA